MTAAKRTAKDVGLRELASGHWQARYRSRNGEDHRETFGSKSEAKSWRARLVAADEEDRLPSSLDRRTVTEWAREYVEARPIRPSTAKRYGGMIAKHIEPTPLGSMRVGDVKPSHVQAWVTSRSVLMNASTLDRVFTFLAGLFKAARQDRVITWSPCEPVRLPSAEPVERLLVTAEQVAAIEAEVPERYRALVRLLALTGLRIGEALALRGEDIDRDAQIIRVRRTLDQKARSVGPVKSARHSRRDIPVSRDVLAMLAAHRLAYPPRWVDDPALTGLLFTSAHGRPLRYDSLAYKVFRPAAERAKAPGITPHDLRHYAGSAMLHDGVPLPVAAKVLGHSVEMLMRTYAHALPSGYDLVRASMANRSRVGTPLARETLAD